MKSPSLQMFEAAVQQARTAKAKALAYYRLAAFHDRNGREAEAIPHYHAALRLGLPAKSKAQALAWLASSYYKTSRLNEARNHVQEADQISKDPKLDRFLTGLKRRIFDAESVDYAQREYGVTEEQLDRFADASDALYERLRVSGELEKYRFTPEQIHEKITR